MKIKYKEISLRRDSLQLVELVNGIVAEYEAQGYSLTLRQIYYQLVSRDYIENNDKSYKRIGELINNARLAGLIDWTAVTDRTRAMQKNNHWSSPRQIISACIEQYHVDTRMTQPNYIEVWVEKEALIDVVGQIARKLDVPYFACRGYVSQSEMWAAAQRFNPGKDNYIIHLGDHDPSGIDMSRDIAERIELFSDATVEIRRIALNYDQIEQYNPPPNPAKITDSRASGYMERHGKLSWELDALNPSIITNLISDAVNTLTDSLALEEEIRVQEKQRREMQTYSKMFE